MCDNHLRGKGKEDELHWNVLIMAGEGIKLDSCEMDNFQAAAAVNVQLARIYSMIKSKDPLSYHKIDLIVD